MLNLWIECMVAHFILNILKYTSILILKIVLINCCYYVRDNVLSGGHYLIKNPDGTNRNQTCTAYYTVTYQKDRRHSSKIPLFNDFVAVS